MGGVVIIVGRFGSGKSTLANRLASDMHAQIYEVGRYAVRRFERQSQFLTPVEFADAMFAEGHFTIFAEDVIQDMRMAEEPKSALSIIVGPRRLAEIDMFKQSLNVIMTIGLTAPDDTRFARHLDQTQTYRTIDYLKLRDSMENSWGIENTLRACDFVVDSCTAAEVSVRHIQEHVMETSRCLLSAL